LPHLAPPRVLSLLAFLIVNRDRRLTRSAVASALWPDELEEDARANLRRHLYRLNSDLPEAGNEPWIHATSATLQWNCAAPAWVDLLEFASLIDSGDSVAAAGLYGGEFLEGTFDDWVVAERERLLSTFLDLAYELAIGARANRDFAAACDYADRMLALGEWREDAARIKIGALYEMGDRPGALAAFDAFSKQLRDDMGVDVMPETRALRETILANVPLTTEPAAARSTQKAQPIVGRSEELDRLLAAWQVAARRTGTTIFVGGEAGVGKTRLLAEFAKSVEMQGGHALFGHAREGEGAPYQPLVDVVRAAAPYLVRDELPDVWLSALAPLVPELVRLHPDLPEIPKIDGGKLRLHEAFARVLESLARRRPVAVILEDMHWANADTLDAIEHLARRAGSSHIVLVATYRPEEASTEHPLREMRRNLQREHRATVLSLGPLDRAAIGALVAEAAPDAAAPEELADAVFRASEGNALFAWQLVQGFIETGAFSSESVAIDQAIAARAARLEPDTRRVLDVASLVGDRFSIEELAEIGAWDESEVFAAVDTLLDLRLLRYATAPGLDLAFAHRLIRDAISAEMPAHGRAGIHRRIAAVLERTRDADAGLVAAHYALAGNRKAAYAGYMYAARSAIATFAIADAIEYATRAIDLSDGDRERFDALTVLLDTGRGSVKTKNWEARVNELEAAAQTLGDDERFEAKNRRCRFLETALRRDEHEAMAAELVAFSEATGSMLHRMHAYHEVGRLAILRGQLREGVDAMDTAVDAAPVAERDLTVQCLTLLSYGLLRLGELERGTEALRRGQAIANEDANPEMQQDLMTAEMGQASVLEDEALYREVGERHLALAAKVGSVSGYGLALASLGQSATMRGDVAGARKHYGEAVELFDRHGLTANYMANMINSGVLERELGNFDVALERWEKMLPVARELKAQTSIACCAINIGEALLARGDVAQALPKLEEALAICRKSAELRLVADAAIALGSAQVRSGHTETGVALMREAIAMRIKIGASRTLPNDYCFLIEALLDLERIEEAAAAAVELQTVYAAAPDKQMFPTRILAALARSAEASGAKAAAKRYLSEGRRRFAARMGQLPDDATRATYAAMDFNRIYGVRAPA
jgi:DNA-binding SARP family transcriptional activator/tetratricopeptide (TPR) repeat protein